MSLKLKRIRVSMKKNKPWIIVGMGLGGWCLTTLLAVQAAPKVKEVIEDKKIELNTNELEVRDTIKCSWKYYAPAFVSGVLSTALILMANSENERRNAALTAAYSISETALKDYQNKIVETIGEKKAKDIQHSIMQDKIDNEPVDEPNIIETGNGNILCWDVYGGRYYKSSKESIQKAINVINDSMNKGEDYISLNDYYDEANLESTELGSCFGWNSRNGLIEIVDSTHLTPDGKPCYVPVFSPKPDYGFDTIL